MFFQAQIVFRLYQRNGELNFDATLNELIIKFTSYILQYEYLILMPVYASVDASISNEAKILDVEF